ncbi:hypothetical protein MSAN_01285100 [Mycena sanguinolenta]|uniref:Uncharacterized protein n=1 Tax=Mycena sanguinolenta TaxID=230812 RepID=A0A8H7D2T5_9AGAR|nr:hypothetical protein MSAN_01285100 [Mycena sanguinolenta]
MLNEIDLSSPVLDAALQILVEADVELADVDSICRAGLATAAEYESMSIRDKNHFFADAVRARCHEKGYFSGWQLLAHTANEVTLNSGMVDDVVKCLQVYNSLRPSGEKGPVTDLRMVITRAPNRDSIYLVAPKSVGGSAWKGSEEYNPAAQRKWYNTGFAPMSPCSSFIWLSVQRKMVARHDLDACNALTLLGTVDFDFDRIEVYKPGFAHAMELAMRYVAEMGTAMQGAALAALLNFDVQRYVRRIQESWIEGRKGAAFFGPRMTPPEDWTATMVGDCGALCAFGYEDAARFSESRETMFVSLLMANIYDLLFDLRTSSLVSSVMYIAAAGVAAYDLHTIFLTTVTDETARRICNGSSTVIPTYGDNSLLATGAWAPFNERYRTWERFVKYTRQLRCSTSPEAQEVLAMANRALILPERNTADAWQKVFAPGVQYTLTSRLTVAYVPLPAPELAKLPPPNVCHTCGVAFTQALHESVGDAIHGIAGLPASVIAAPAVSRAAAIRRAAFFASSAECCEVCACSIGCWADLASYLVLTALMRSDESTSAAEWLLETYAVWTVTTSPVSVATVLSGFDLRCDVREEEGAMGSRDVLDC